MVVFNTGWAQSKQAIHGQRERERDTDQTVSSLTPHIHLELHHHSQGTPSIDRSYTTHAGGEHTVYSIDLSGMY